MRSPLLRFICVFVPVYGVLIAPWPGFGDLYATYFRALTGAVLSANSAHRIVQFGRGSPAGPLDITITVADPAQRDADGRIRGHVLALDSRGVGWIPTALVAALVLSTPVPWRRRFKAVVPGLLAIHVYIIATVWIFVWNESNRAGAEAMQSSIWNRVANILEETLVTQIGASIVIPVVVWYFVLTTRQDLDSKSQRCAIPSPHC